MLRWGTVCPSADGFDEWATGAWSRLIRPVEMPCDEKSSSFYVQPCFCSETSCTLETVPAT